MFGNITGLIEHHKTFHGADREIESQTFECWDHFLAWKTEEEKITKSWFVQQRADRWTRSYKTSWFYCNRTGKFDSKGNGKRALKSQGSSKMGGADADAELMLRRGK